MNLVWLYKITYQNFWSVNWINLFVQINNSVRCRTPFQTYRIWDRYTSRYIAFIHVGICEKFSSYYLNDQFSIQSTRKYQWLRYSTRMIEHPSPITTILSSFFKRQKAYREAIRYETDAFFFFSLSFQFTRSLHGFFEVHRQKLHNWSF